MSLSTHPGICLAALYAHNIVMAEKSFRAFDLAGRNAHTIPDVIRIDKHRLRGGEWPSTRGRSVVSQDVMDARVEEVLRCSDPSDACEHCKPRWGNISITFVLTSHPFTGGADGSDPSCDTDCYTSFVKSFLPTSLIELRGPGPLGYSTFVKRGVNLKKHTWLGEYIGELRPLKKVNLDLAVGVQSMYRFDVTLQDRETVVLDSEKAGNWTRYMNSSCEPNCEVW